VSSRCLRRLSDGLSAFLGGLLRLLQRGSGTRIDLDRLIGKLSGLLSFLSESFRALLG
jgi:hypothetical protein